MSNINIQYFCDRLAELSSLADANIVEEYTSAEMPRPVKVKTVSVGIKSVSTVPISRASFRMSVQLQARLLFPCGMGDNAIGAATEEIISKFSGELIYGYYVTSVTCGESKFDNTAYAVRANVIFNLEYLHEKSNGSQSTKATVSVGELEFPMLPSTITILRPDFDEQVDEAGNVSRRILPREFTLKGHAFESPNSTFFEGLNELTETTDAVSLSLPYMSSVQARCKKLEIEYDGGGYGFDYTLVLIEKM